MSKAGYHWQPKDEARPVPCFKCNTEPRLEGHSVCSSCHVEASCARCWPALHPVAPANLVRGVLRGGFVE